MVSAAVREHALKNLGMLRTDKVRAVMSTMIYVEFHLWVNALKCFASQVTLQAVPPDYDTKVDMPPLPELSPNTAFYQGVGDLLKLVESIHGGARDSREEVSKREASPVKLGPSSSANDDTSPEEKLVTSMSEIRQCGQVWVEKLNRLARYSTGGLLL